MLFSDQGSGDQRHEALLFRLLKIPPKPRPKRDRGKAIPAASRERPKERKGGSAAWFPKLSRLYRVV
jgi:hypothetical protein